MLSFKEIVEIVGLVIDWMGVLIILFGLMMAIYRFFLSNRGSANAYQQFRQGIGRSILLGLEFMVAADIIRTVALPPTMQGVLILGIIVLIRTFLSLTLEVELGGRWPWKVAQQNVSDDRTQNSS